MAYIIENKARFNKSTINYLPLTEGMSKKKINYIFEIYFS